MGQSPNLHWFLTQKCFSPRNNAKKNMVRFPASPEWPCQACKHNLRCKAATKNRQVGPIPWQLHSMASCISNVRGGVSGATWSFSRVRETRYFGRDTPSDGSLTSSHPCRSLGGSNHQKGWMRGQEMGCDPCTGSQHCTGGARM